MLLVTLTLILGCTSVLAANSEKFFRRDYIYNEIYSAFYKVHWGVNSKTWQDAFITCDKENAKLFFPDSLEEWKIAANLTESLQGVENIFVGVRDEFGQGDFVSVEGRFVPEFMKNSTAEKGTAMCAVLSVNTGCYNVELCKQKMPFICKRVDDESCPTIDSAYVYSKATKKCYKVNESQSTWQDAFHNCIIEGGILLNPTKDTETVLHSLLNDEQFYYIGIRRMTPQTPFYSLLGTKFEILNMVGNKENCIAVQVKKAVNMASYPYPSCPENKIGIRSFDCNTTLPFVCEMQNKILT